MDGKLGVSNKATSLYSMRSVMLDNKILKIDCKDDELHIRLGGIYTASTAALLTTVIKQIYDGQERILVNTDAVTEVADDAKNTLDDLIGLISLPKDKVYLTGIMGGIIGSNSLHVIPCEGQSDVDCNCLENCKM